MEAKRGDLVVLEIRHRDFILQEGMRERYEYRVGKVTAVTRAGVVKAALQAGSAPITWGNGNGGYPLDRMTGLVRWWVAPKSGMDVDGALRRAAENTYPGHATVRGFDTLEEAQDALRPFRREVANI